MRIILKVLPIEVLAWMDKRNIRIPFIEFDHDDNDTSWI